MVQLHSLFYLKIWLPTCTGTVASSLQLCITPRVRLPVCDQIADLLAELADERSTSESASQLLEAETSERLRLEKDMKDLQANKHEIYIYERCTLKIYSNFEVQFIMTDMLCVIIDWICAFQAKFDAMKKQLESQEMEVMEARLMKTSELNGEMDIDDEDAG